MRGKKKQKTTKFFTVFGEEVKTHLGTFTSALLLECLGTSPDYATSSSLRMDILAGSSHGREWRPP